MVKIRYYLLFIFPAFFATSCSVNEDVIYSIASADGDIVSQWPYSKSGLNIHVRPDNTTVNRRSTRILGLPVETVAKTEGLIARPFKVYIAVKKGSGFNASWEPAKTSLIYDRKKMTPVELTYVNLIALEDDCFISKSGFQEGAVELEDEYYVCISAEFDIETINPSENFKLELFGLTRNGEALEPIVLDFNGVQYKSVKF